MGWDGIEVFCMRGDERDSKMQIYTLTQAKFRSTVSIILCVVYWYLGALKCTGAGYSTD